MSGPVKTHGPLSTHEIMDLMEMEVTVAEGETLTHRQKRNDVTENVEVSRAVKIKDEKKEKYVTSLSNEHGNMPGDRKNEQETASPNEKKTSSDIKHCDAEAPYCVNQQHNKSLEKEQIDGEKITADAAGYTNNGYETGDDDKGDKAKDLERGKANGTVKEAVDDEESDPDEINLSSCFLFVGMRVLKAAIAKHSSVLWVAVKTLLFLLYLAYTGYSVYHSWGTEGATRLLLLLAIALCVTVGKRLVSLLQKALSGTKLQKHSFGKARKVGKWCLYLVLLVGAAVYLGLEVAVVRPRNLSCLAGLVFLVIISILMSANPEKVNWHTVFLGIALQFYLAVFVLRTSIGYEIFKWLGDRIMEFIKHTDVGSEFIFGQTYTDHRYAFQVLPIILFTNSIIAILYHFGAVQAFIATFGRFLAFCLGTTPIESVNTVSNIFLSVTEAPLLVKPFLDRITDSELFAIMTGGFASISGAAMGTIVSFGIPANHVLIASMMSAPAALAVAKIMYPSTKRAYVTAQDAYTLDMGGSKNLLEAISNAAVMGVKIAVTVGANILVLVAILNFADQTVAWFGHQAGVDDLSLKRLLSYLFYPLMYVCGVDEEDLLVLARLFGLKFVTNIHLAYMKAADIIRNSQVLASYTATTNGTWYWSGDDVILQAWNQTLIGGVMNERSVVMSTYILCGMCNMPALALTIGLMSALTPKRATFIVSQAAWALMAGNIACLMTGCVAGLLFI